MSKVVRGLDDKALYAAEVASISFKDVAEAQWEFLDEKRKTGKDTTPDADAAERGRSFVKASRLLRLLETWNDWPMSTMIIRISRLQPLGSASDALVALNSSIMLIYTELLLLCRAR